MVSLRLLGACFIPPCNKRVPHCYLSIKSYGMIPRARTYSKS